MFQILKPSIDPSVIKGFEVIFKDISSFAADYQCI